MKRILNYRWAELAFCGPGLGDFSSSNEEGGRFFEFLNQDAQDEQDFRDDVLAYLNHDFRDCQDFEDVDTPRPAGTPLKRGFFAFKTHPLHFPRLFGR